MNLHQIYDLEGKGGISGFFSCTSNFGMLDGYQDPATISETGFQCIKEQYEVTGLINESDGVFLRNDTITNRSDETMHLYHYNYRFCLPGGDYQVYTQFSNWQNESAGAWQPLVTGITASAKGVRTADGATPFLAVWNCQTNRGIAFHVMPNSAWVMSVTKKQASRPEEYTVIELGIQDNALDLSIEQDKSISLFSVLYYEFEHKIGFDSWKLHNFFLNQYPRRELPILYNTWFAFFDRIYLDEIFEEIKEAATLGFEYFTIDAGWFGNGTWCDHIGDWRENQTDAFKGKLREVSDQVHRSGMKLGLWLEPERALKHVPSVMEHPDYFFSNGNSYFIDFANDEARQYITNVTLDLIEQYQVDLIKFDFNENMVYDESRTGFFHYRKGHLEYIKAIKEKYPHIYLENCASGGNRMELEQLKYFDSFWFSDNQSPYEGMRIFKDTVHRLPPCGIEKWLAPVSIDGFVPSYGTTDQTVRTMASNNATWDSVINISPEYAAGFLTGGPVGITCRLVHLSDTFKNSLREFIQAYKKERHFWIGASCTVLMDTETTLALQYQNKTSIKLVVYTFGIAQSSVTLYPLLSGNEYQLGQETKTRSELHQNGITIQTPKRDCSYTISLKQIR